MLTVCLMGVPSFEEDGAVVAALNTHQFVALIGGVLLEPGRKVSRAELGQRFWPAQDDTDRRRNLRQMLYRLRQAWPEARRYLSFDTHLVYWRDEAPVLIDVDRISTLLERPVSEASVEELWLLIRGELMSSHNERWILRKRRDQAMRLTRYLQRAAEWSASHGFQRSRVRCHEMLVQLDPEREDRWAELADVCHALGMADTVEELRERLAHRVRHAAAAPPPAEVVRAGLTHGAAGHAPERPLLGRGGALANLEALWAKVRHGPPSVACVEGAPGMGKSTLIEALSARVEAEGALVLRLRCFEGTSSSPYFVLTELTRQLWPGVDLWDPSGASGKAQPGLSTLRETGAASELVEAGWLRRLETELDTRPLLLVLLDNAQWCDRPSLTLLSALFLRRGASRRMLVMTLTPQTPHAQDPELRCRVDELLRCHNSHTERLEALEQSDAQALLKATLNRPIALEDLDSALSWGAGIPGRLVEITSTLNGERRPPPSPHEQQLRYLLQRLPAPAREAAQLGAALGERFGLGALRAAARQDLDLNQAVEHLLDAGWWVECAEDDLRWASSAFRSAAMTTLRSYFLPTATSPQARRGADDDVSGVALVRPRFDEAGPCVKPSTRVAQ